MINDNDYIEKWDEGTEKDWKEKMSEPIGFDVFSPEEFEKNIFGKLDTTDKKDIEVLDKLLEEKKK